MIGRIISLVLSGLYVVGAYWAGGGESFGKALIFCLLPLACIWFPDDVGEYTGNGLTLPSITAESPGCVMKVVGWVLLLFPIWGGGLVWVILTFLV
jgi:hypothetical protein